MRTHQHVVKKELEEGVYFLLVEYIEGEVSEADYVLHVGLFKVENGTTPITTDDGNRWLEIFNILTYIILGVLFIIIIILSLHLFTSVRIPWLSNQFDKYLRKGGKGETVRSLKYALRVRDDNIERFREEMIEKVLHRKAHDFRYAISGNKLKSLGFEYKYRDLELEIKNLINWYKDNENWWRPLKR